MTTGRDNPTVTRADGTMEWWLNKPNDILNSIRRMFNIPRRRILHRVDGPAVVRPDGSNFWFIHGILHRENGPAITHIQH